MSTKEVSIKDSAVLYSKMELPIYQKPKEDKAFERPSLIHLLVSSGSIMTNKFIGHKHY